MRLVISFSFLKQQTTESVVSQCMVTSPGRPSLSCSPLPFSHGVRAIFRCCCFWGCFRYLHLLSRRGELLHSFHKVDPVIELSRAYAHHHFSFRVLSNHSQSMHCFGNELDHLGVVFVIWGSAIPSTHFGFRCEPHLRLTHWTLVSTGWVVFRVSTFADGAFDKVSPGFALIISFSDNGVRYGFCYL
jgi:Haemolysin-III related